MLVCSMFITTTYPYSREKNIYIWKQYQTPLPNLKIFLDLLLSEYQCGHQELILTRELWETV